MEQPLARHKTVKQALEYVAKKPQPDTDPIETPMWELIAGCLFRIANSPDKNVRGAVAKATRAQKIILDRMVGARAPGTHPAQMQSEEITFKDLTDVPSLTQVKEQDE